MSGSEKCVTVPVDLIHRLLHWVDVGWNSQREYAGPGMAEDFRRTRREADAVLAKAAERED